MDQNNARPFSRDTVPPYRGQPVREAMLAPKEKTAIQEGGRACEAEGDGGGGVVSRGETSYPGHEVSRQLPVWQENGGDLRFVSRQISDLIRGMQTADEAEQIFSMIERANRHATAVSSKFERPDRMNEAKSNRASLREQARDMGLCDESVETMRRCDEILEHIQGAAIEAEQIVAGLHERNRKMWERDRNHRSPAWWIRQGCDLLKRAVRRVCNSCVVVPK